MAQQSDTPVHLPAALAEEIIAHAREGKPEEICGIIRGRGLAAFESIRSKNIAEERIENYTVDPNILRLQNDFEEEGDEMMGVYHSHPASEAYPSATDAWNAAYYPDIVYFICSLEDDDAPNIRAFRMPTQFIELDLTAAKAEIAFDETRPGLFAYRQNVGCPIPAILEPLTGTATPPYYIVYTEGNGMFGEGELDIHLVELIEHPITTE